MHSSDRNGTSSSRPCSCVNFGFLQEFEKSTSNPPMDRTPGILYDNDNILLQNWHGIFTKKWIKIDWSKFWWTFNSMIAMKLVIFDIFIIHRVSLFRNFSLFQKIHLPFAKHFFLCNNRYIFWIGSDFCIFYFFFSPNLIQISQTSFFSWF